MNCHVLVAMGRSDESDAALKHALEEHPDTTSTVIHVTASSDLLDLFGGCDPEDYLIPD